jgi:hypothetical protein
MKPTNTMDLVSYGLTKRDYFSGLAMQALISTIEDESPATDIKLVPSIAVAVADLLIAELEKEKEE